MHVATTPTPAGAFTPEELQSLTERMNTGDVEARDTLINSAWPVAYSLLRQFGGRGVDNKDLLQEAWLGMVRASEDYDPKKGSFSHHASYWVRENMRMAVMNHGNRVRVKSGILRKYSLLQKYVAARSGEAASDAEICRDLGFSKETLRSIRQCEATLGSTSITEGLDAVDEDTDEDDEVVSNFIAERDGLLNAVRTLPKQQRYIVERLFGLCKCDKKTQRELSVLLGLSPTAVRRLKTAALQNLQASLAHLKQDGAVAGPIVFADKRAV